MPNKQLCVLEFYSGIGGFRVALQQHLLANSSALYSETLWLKSYDINSSANEVYKYNFDDTPCTKNIEHLSCKDLSSLLSTIKQPFDLWICMSPPCQPCTSAGL